MTPDTVAWEEAFQAFANDLGVPADGSRLYIADAADLKKLWTAGYEAGAAATTPVRQAVYKADKQRIAIGTVIRAIQAWQDVSTGQFDRMFPPGTREKGYDLHTFLYKTIKDAGIDLLTAEERSAP